MTDWLWFRPFRNEHRGAVFAEESGNTFLFDGNKLLLLDRKGKETQVGSDEELVEREAFGDPQMLAISSTALYMACYFRDGDEMPVITVYNRRGKPTSTSKLSYPLESLAFDAPETLIGVVDSTMIKNMFTEPLQLTFAIGKSKDLAPEIEPQSKEVIARIKDHSIHDRGDQNYEIQRRGKSRAVFKAGATIRLIHFSPTGKSFSALEGEHKIVTYSLDGTQLGVIETESAIDDFRYYEDGSVLYICNDRLVKVGAHGDLMWKRTHPMGVRGTGRVHADSGYFLVYFEAEGAYHSWAYDVFGNVLSRHQSNYPHMSKLFVSDKALFIWERGRVGLASLYGEDFD
ncbi:MAG: hypothetical protein KC609_24845 [Myxococcales bacterium]|nr:hypothetical protein [Myxococcales bacterium]